MSTEYSGTPKLDEEAARSENVEDRRARRRREPGKLGDEIATVLSDMDPEVRSEMKKLVSSSKPQEIEEKMLDYVVRDERESLLRRFTQRKAGRDRKTVSRGTRLVMMIPVVAALYCIFSIVFTGHIKLPW